MISCSGLPICLSGVQLFPQNRQLNRSHELRSRNSLASSPSTSDRFSQLSDSENLNPNCVSTASAVVPDDDSRNLPDRDGNMSEVVRHRRSFPRLALRQQMADLDCRREAIRRRRPRSDNTMETRLSTRLKSILSAYLERQFQEDDYSESSDQNVCAKAA